MSDSRRALYDEIYPLLSFPGGWIQWETKEWATVCWGNKEYKIEYSSFPQGDHLKANDIISWVYRNMEILDSEIENSFIYWDRFSRVFMLEVIRGKDTVYRQKITNPHLFKNYITNDAFTYKLIGNLLHVTSKRHGVSPLCGVSHPITLDEEISRFFDIDDNFYMLIPIGKEGDKVIIGIKESIERLKEDDQYDNFEIFPLKQWQQEIGQE